MRQPVTMRQAGQRSWLTLAFVVLGVLALSLSNVEPAGARTAATSLSAGAGDTHANGILQETARQVSAKGRWWRDRDERYLGGRALSARQKGASLAVTFTGTGLRIIGPRSLTRGRARIYVDGRHVATVNAHAATYRGRRNLFVATWASEKRRTVRIVVAGTAGHPVFTVDAFVVRVRGRSGCDPAPTTTGRPFRAPVTKGTYQVPASVDGTGATDVSTHLNNWISNVPDGSVVSFRPGTYLLSKGIQLGNRRNLIFEGNGATLKTTGSGSDYVASPFVLGWSHKLKYWTGGSRDIAIRHFTLVGNDPSPGEYGGGGENQMGVQIVGTRNLEVSGVTIRAVRGDGFFVNTGRNVWLHDNRVVTAGRSGVTVIKGCRVLVERSAFDTVGYVTFNNEPNERTEASSRLTFRNNTAGTWGLTFFSVEGGHRGAPINRVTVHGEQHDGQGAGGPGRQRRDGPASQHRVQQQPLDHQGRRAASVFRPYRRPDRHGQQPAAQLRQARVDPGQHQRHLPLVEVPVPVEPPGARGRPPRRSCGALVREQAG